MAFVPRSLRTRDRKPWEPIPIEISEDDYKKEELRSMKHFEDIWNDGETVASQLMESLNEIDREDYFNNIISEVDNIRRGYTVESGYDVTATTKAVGEILWELCVLCKIMELEHKVINSAAALQLAINKRKAKLLDPENENEDS